MQLSIRSFVEDVLSIPTDCSDMKFILMYTSYLIGSAEDLDELCTAAHRFLLNMKDFSSSMNVSNRLQYFVMTMIFFYVFVSKTLVLYK